MFRIRSLCPWMAILLLLSIVSMGDADEAQPLRSNISRVITALDSLGFPFSPERQSKIDAALEHGNLFKLQAAVDPEVLAVVSINPEERVSVTRGAAKAVLQQQGYRPALIKVVNHSTSTSRLRVTSPQAGAVYAGVSEFTMRRQQRTDLSDNQNNDHRKDRFLDLDLYDSAPLTPQLSGFDVEYAVVLIASQDSGKREAVLHFDIGDGTADLEHRNELPVLFEVRPAVPVKLKVTESDGASSIARIEFRDVTGRVYPLQAKRVAPDFFFQPHVYRADGETVSLPPGKFDVVFSRGPEYNVVRDELNVDANQSNHYHVQLERWIDTNAMGWFSGDHHIHAAGCSHYTHPSEGVTPQDMFRQVQGEGLNVGCVLTWGPCFDHQRGFFQAKPQMFGTHDTLLKYDLEISGFGSQALGHVCLLNLENQTYPNSNGTKTQGWPTWTTPVMRWAKNQGGYAGYAHSASGLAIDPVAASNRIFAGDDVNRDDVLDLQESTKSFLPLSFGAIDLDRNGQLSMDEMVMAHRVASQQLPNFAIPEMNGVGAMEICVSTVAGVCDFISAMDTARIQEWNTWYHILNCGFPLKVSGETDFPCMSSRRVGQGRVYVRLGSDVPLNFADWCEGMVSGRSYVSDGYAHLPRFKINDHRLGEGDVRLSGPGNVKVSAQVAFAPEVPEAVAHGTLKPTGRGREVIGDTVLLHGNRSDRWVVGGKRLVELVVNGEPVETREVPADGKLHEIEFNRQIDRSSWVAIRQFPQLHSNPINVIVGDRPIRASRKSAQWCVAMTQLLWKNRELRISEGERAEAKKAFDHAISVFQDIAQQSAD